MQDEILSLCVAFGALAVVHLGVSLSKQDVQHMDCCSVSSGGLFHFYAINPHPVSYKRRYVIAGGVGKSTTKGGWPMKSVLATFLIIVAFIVDNYRFRNLQVL